MSHSQEAVDPNPGLADSHSTTCLPEGLHSDSGEVSLPLPVAAAYEERECAHHWSGVGVPG